MNLAHNRWRSEESYYKGTPKTLQLLESAYKGMWGKVTAQAASNLTQASHGSEERQN